jgi:hypothetical protein
MLVGVAGIAAFVSVPDESRRAPATTADSVPRAISGGRFEASGVAHVPGTNLFLFVDDGRQQEIFLMELEPGNQQKGSATRVPLAANVTDLEGMTSDGRHFFVVGSQSKTTGFDGDGLVRFTFDARTRTTNQPERIQGLKAWLAANVPELRGVDRRVGDAALNVEGLAWDPREKRLLLGLRAPVVNGQALVIPVKLNGSSFTRENLQLAGPAIHLDLGGAGIRSLEFDERSATFRVIAGADLNNENRDFRILEWDGRAKSPAREVASFASKLKPEGITLAIVNGRPVSVVVFDVGRYVVID